MNGVKFKSEVKAGQSGAGREVKEAVMPGTARRPRLRSRAAKISVQIVAALSLAPAALLGVSASLQAASAGTNGQQVVINNPNGGMHVWLCGYNQAGNWTCWPYYTWLQYYQTTFPGYWWAGNVYIYEYTWSGQYIRTRTCYVPRNQPGYDWTACTT